MSAKHPYRKPASIARAEREERNRVFIGRRNAKEKREADARLAHCQRIEDAKARKDAEERLDAFWRDAHNHREGRIDQDAG